MQARTQVRRFAVNVNRAMSVLQQDGRPVTPRNDYYRVGEACRAAEKLLNLRATARRDRTAGRQPNYGEREKAQRKGLPDRPGSPQLVLDVQAAVDQVGQQ
jgi:hypothetical protein